jgi:hypothetical protein
MKTRFSNSAECIHAFAQQNQPNGRSSNVFFEKTLCYSYGYHYVLAEFVKNSKGKEAVIINDSGYSNTTAKHIRIMIDATGHYTQFYTRHTDTKRVLINLELLIEKFIKARRPEIYINEANKIFAGYSDYMKWTGKKSDDHAKIVRAYKAFTTKEATNYFAKKAAYIKRIEAAELKKRIMKYNKDLAEFYNYELSYISKPDPSYTDKVRLSKNGESVETSQGVTVTRKSAKLLYTLIKSGRDVKGHNIDGYTVISINGCLKIGCHNIDINDVHKIGGVL